MARSSAMEITFAGIFVMGLALLSTANAAVAECPKNLKPNETLQIPHETDCTKYYTCLGQSKILRECPFMDNEGNRLHFNPKLQVCDWPYNAGCELLKPLKSLSRNGDVESLMENRQCNPPTTCPLRDDPKYTVHLRHDYDCHKFYKCSYGKAYEMKCPPMTDGSLLVFNRCTQTCDWPWNVDCDTGYPYPTDPYPTDVYPSKVASLSKEISRINERNVPCNPPTTCPLRDDPKYTVHLRHDYDCHKFYKCSYGKAYEMKCPPMTDGSLLVFNRCTQTCDWPWNVNCDTGFPYPTDPYPTDVYPSKVASLSKEISRISERNVPCNPPTTCPLRDDPKYTVHLRHDYDCHKFYKCSYGKAYEMKCPPMTDGSLLVFNRCTQTCDWPWNVDCDTGYPYPNPTSVQVASISKEVVRKLGEDVPCDAPTTCPAKDDPNFTVHLNHEKDCHKFYKCSFGKKFEMKCASLSDGSLSVFNRCTQTCDWPSNVDCATGYPLPIDAIPTKVASPSKEVSRISEKYRPCDPPTKCPLREDPHFTVHLRHDYDCHMFYKCSYGTRYEMKCPPMTDGGLLVFNVCTQTCDWPWNVDCDTGFPYPGETFPTPPTLPPTPPTPPPTPPTPPPTPPTPPPTPPTPPPTPPTPPPTPPTPTPDPGIKGCRGTCPTDTPPNVVVALPHDDCRRWCSCSNGVPTALPCPADLEFSEELGKCTSPEKAYCHRGRTTQRSLVVDPADEALMNILGYNNRFLW